MYVLIADLVMQYTCLCMVAVICYAKWPHILVCKLYIIDQLYTHYSLQRSYTNENYK